jgi:hypothetical protein
MEIKEYGLLLYFTATIAAIISVALGFETLRLFTNPVVIPAIAFYYIFEKQEKYSHLYGVVLFLCFIGDILIFLNLDVVLYIMIPYFISYLVLFSFLIQDIRKVFFNKKAFIISSIIFLCLLFLVFLLVKSLVETNFKLVIPVTVYGLFLSIYGSTGIYYFIRNKTILAKYLLFFIVLSIFSDVFFVVFKLISSFHNLVYIEFGAQLFSYYYMVKYFSLRKLNNNRS